MRQVVMLGSALDVRGGVSAMVRVCLEHGLFDRQGATYLETHVDGSRWRKLAQAARAWIRFMRLLLTGRVALAHVHLNSDASFWRKSLFLVPAMALGVPCVLQVHCGAFLDFYRDRCGPAARAFVRWVLRRARAVVALSELSREALLRIDPALEVLVIPNPVRIPAEPAPLDRGPPTVLFLGMITEAKGAFDLLRAWPRVREAIPGARLVLAGEGDRERAGALAREYGFEDCLEMPGWVVGTDKERLVARAWALALPSRWEAMPMAVLEAMAAGLPVVASRVGGIPATVADGRTGVLVEARDINRLAEALAALLSRAPLRKAMGTAARERARSEFSADVVVPRIEALWRALLPSDGRVGLEPTRG